MSQVIVRGIKKVPVVNAGRGLSAVGCSWRSTWGAESLYMASDAWKSALVELSLGGRISLLMSSTALLMITSPPITAISSLLSGTVYDA
jgi:hypothetical protein